MIRKDKLKEIKTYIEAFKTISSTDLVTKADGEFLKVASSNYTLANNKTIEREEIVKKHTDAVVILPITTGGNVLLVVQPRPLTKEGVTIELPAGYVDEGEEPIDAVYRELKEETGYIPSSTPKYLGHFYQDQGCSRSLNYLYLALNCEKVEMQDLDEDEYITYFECQIKEMLELIDMGYIKSANSVLTVNLARQSVKKLNKKIK